MKTSAAVLKGILHPLEIKGVGITTEAREMLRYCSTELGSDVGDVPVVYRFRDRVLSSNFVGEIVSHVLKNKFARRIGIFDCLNSVLNILIMHRKFGATSEAYIVASETLETLQFARCLFVLIPSGADKRLTLGVWREQSDRGKYLTSVVFRSSDPGLLKTRLKETSVYPPEHWRV